jgi:hypothetical protein
MQSNSSGSPTDDSGTSITSQAVMDGMDLNRCVESVKFVNENYIQFNTGLTSLQRDVRKAKAKLSAIDIVSHNIIVNEKTFGEQLKRLNDLYNALAIRSNALGKWMTDEKSIRDELIELYKKLVQLNRDEETRLSSLRTVVAQALKKLEDVQAATAKVLDDVSTAQVGMYDWAVNVTSAVNDHTTKQASLQQGMSFRVTQIDRALPEMRNIATLAYKCTYDPPVQLTYL